MIYFLIFLIHLVVSVGAFLALPPEEALSVTWTSATISCLAATVYLIYMIRKGLK
ncbi:hypothetical protein HOV23_gp074 [Pseudomonas phage Lana]|uniref:Uncharacterized protein n=1 Tax=Pseudomonas phage Lana TaxID=2530172 RepID=A0A481W7P6_9CAUD|nr:hypothetical protein HOV23_gp074 [Pseudomonas phage Lana]QBJ04499.1 hypothetical protein [Pseudomonas phage Lana]